MSRRVGLVRVLAGALFVVSAAAALLLIEHYRLMPTQPDHWSADWRTALLSDRAATQHPAIALVTINDEVLADYPYQTPIDRGLLASVIEAVDRAGARAIGLDFIFTRPTEPGKDEALIAALRSAKAQVVMGTAEDAIALNERQRSYHRQFLERVGRPVAHLFFDVRRDLLRISDQVVRQAAAREASSQGRRSFAELLAVAIRPDARLNSRQIAWLLPPADGSDAFLTLPADALESVTASGLLEGRIVLIGGDFPDRDRHLTPLSILDQSRMLGLAIHAHIIAQLVDGRSLRALDATGTAALYLAIAGLGYLLGHRYRLGRFDLVVGLAGSLVLVFAGILAFAAGRLVLPFTGPVLLWGIAVTGGHYSHDLLDWLGLGDRMET